MLNISKNNDVLITPGRFKSINSVARKPHYKFLNMVVIGFLLFGVFCLFLPWTQNISGSGSVTTLKPDQRPQTVHNTIAGKIEKWYVQEGDYVKKGDTILFISEVKEDYLNPNLVGNTKQQVDAIKMALESYGDKVNSYAVKTAKSTNIILVNKDVVAHSPMLSLVSGPSLSKASSVTLPAWSMTLVIIPNDGSPMTKQTYGAKEMGIPVSSPL